MRAWVIAAASVLLVLVGAAALWVLVGPGAFLAPVPAPTAPAIQALAAASDAPPVTQSAPAPPASTPPADTPETEDAETISMAFHGVVQAAGSGEAIAGAKVRLIHQFEMPAGLNTEAEDVDPALEAAVQEAFGGLTLYAAETGADGAYRLELNEIQAHALDLMLLVCEAPGHARGEKPLENLGSLASGHEARVDFSLRPGTRITGRVTRNDTGAPVAGARIRAEKSMDESAWAMISSTLHESVRPPITATSGDDGSYALIGLEEGTYAIDAGSADDTLRLLPKGETEVAVKAGVDAAKDLVLSPAAIVRGKIIYPEGAATPEFVSVSVERTPDPIDGGSSTLPFEMPSGFDEALGMATPDGNYRVAGLEFGVEYTVEVSAEGFPTTESAPFRVAEGQSPYALDITVARGSTLRGKAFYEDGKPAPGVKLMLSQGIQAFMRGDINDFHPPVETGSDGAFEIAGAAPGEYKIVEPHKQYEFSDPFTQDASEEEELIPVDGVTDVNGLEVTIEGNAPANDGSDVITGVVLDMAGNPVPGEMVFAHGEELSDSKDTETGPDGRFRIKGLRDKSYNVYAFGDGEKAEADGVAVGSDISLQLAPEAKITGTVTAANGEPASEVTVQLVQQGSEGGGAFAPMAFMALMGMGGDTAKTNEFGLFEFSDPEPGRYVVRVASGPAGFGESDPFDVAEGESKSGIHIALAKGVRFAGTVTDTSGKPIPEATVSLRKAISGDSMMEQAMAQAMDFMPEEMMGDGPGALSATTDANGMFSIENVPPGSYRVGARAENYASAVAESVEFTAGRDTTGHRIVLSGGGCIAGKAIINGESKAGLSVQAVGDNGSKDGTTGEDGRFEICGLNAGTYMVVVMDMSSIVSNPFAAATPPARRAEVKDGETTEVDFSPPAGAVSVRGTVRGEREEITMVTLQRKGAPGPANSFDIGAAIEAIEFLGGQAMTDAGGNFVINDVAPDDYVLEVTSNTMDMEDLGTFMGKPEEIMESMQKPRLRQEITVPAGQDLVLDLELPAPG